MKLMLSITRCPSGSNMEGQQYQFGPEGGTFGRSADNAWVLPDVSRHVSSLHAKVSFENDQFVLNDQSTNGLFVNGSSQALGPNNPVALKNGDQLSFGDYCLNVTLVETLSPTSDADIDPAATQLSAPVSDSVYVDDLDKWLEPVSPESESLGSVNVKFDTPSIPQTDALSDIDLGLKPQETDPLAALGGANVPSQPLGSSGGSLSDLVGNTSPLDQQMMKVPNVIPNDWDDLLGEEASASSVPQQKNVQLKPANKDSDITHLDKVTKQEVSADSTSLVKQPLSDNLENSGPAPVPVSNESLKSPDALGLSELLSTPSDQLQGVSKDLTAPQASIATERPSESVEEQLASDDPLKELQLKAQLDDSNETSTSRLVKDQPETAKQESLHPVKTSQAEASKADLEIDASSLASASANAISAEAESLAKELGLEQLSEQQKAVLEKTVANTVKETVSGMMRTLRARSEIKSEFRMNMTTIQSAENNPLKFSVTPEDAIENMFAKQGKAYLSPVDAINDGFADISDHQVALFDAMKAAYEHIFGQFDPEFLAKKFERTAGKRFLGGKVKKWEAYSHLYSEYKEDNDKTFKRLFGEVFADAYERRMHALKMSRGDSSRK